MPNGASKKRDRQHVEHIRDLYKDRRVVEKDAEELAARIVNKQRTDAKTLPKGRRILIRE